jgi:5-methylcytosine-specific restriction endonuclease McrA
VRPPGQKRSIEANSRPGLAASDPRHIDHINGVRDDHRLENLRMLCPNCHSQTSTYGGRDVKRRRRLQEPPTLM